jgi:hypothetical protein
MSKARPEQERQLLYSNGDANGGVINPEQMAKIQRMKPWNKISSNTRSYHRNLKNAFAILSTVKDKPSLNDALRKICL